MLLELRLEFELEIGNELEFELELELQFELGLELRFQSVATFILSSTSPVYSRKLLKDGRPLKL